MARETYVFDESTGEVIPKRDSIRRQSAPARSHLPRPMLVSDAILPGVSQVSGKMHDTRSGLMQDYRDYEARTGKRIEIVGDQTHHLSAEGQGIQPDEKAIDSAIKSALEMHDA